jgi:hypothetical protein
MNEILNGYAAMAESYRKMALIGKIPKDVAGAEARVLDFLGTCSEEDFCRIFNSTALNDIVKGYVQIALDWSSLNEEQCKDVMYEFNRVLDEYTAEEVLKIKNR